MGDDQQQASQTGENVLMGEETPVENVEEEPKDPNIELLYSIQHKLEPGEFDFYVQKIAELDKKTMLMIKCYQKS
jgi:hypothetical protein